MDSLHIPARERLKGQNILCTLCYKKGKGLCSTKDKKSGKQKWVCKENNKHLNSCANPINQRFVSFLYNPFTQKSDIRINHLTRDFYAFRKRHNELLEIELEIKNLYNQGLNNQSMVLINSFRSKKGLTKKEDLTTDNRRIIITPDTYLESAMKIYNDWLKKDKGGIREQRPATGTANNYRRALNRFHTCLVKNKYNPEIISLSSLDREHINSWVEEVFKRYESPKTQNHYLNDIATFFSWCTKRGGGVICNELDMIERGQTKGDKTIVNLKDFNKMIELVTPENGKGKEIWIDGKTGIQKSKNKDYYRDWLKDALWLSLLMGGRGKEMTLFQWNEVKYLEGENGNKAFWIELEDHKVKDKDDNMIPVFKKTYEILMKLGLNNKIGTNEYVIAPEVLQRTTIENFIGKAWKWYWQEVAKLPPSGKYKSLRSTYITLATNLLGENSKYIQKHTTADVTRKHYYDATNALAGLFGKDFEDVNALKFVPKINISKEE